MSRLTPSTAVKSPKRLLTCWKETSAAMAARYTYVAALGNQVSGRTIRLATLGLEASAGLAAKQPRLSSSTARPAVPVHHEASGAPGCSPASPHRGRRY